MTIYIITCIFEDKLDGHKNKSICNAFQNEEIATLTMCEMNKRGGEDNEYFKIFFDVEETCIID